MRGLRVQHERVQLAAGEPRQRSHEAAAERRAAGRLDAVEGQVAAVQQAPAADDRRARGERGGLRPVDGRVRRVPGDALVERPEEPLRRAEQQRPAGVRRLDEERRGARVGRQRARGLADETAPREQHGAGDGADGGERPRTRRASEHDLAQAQRELQVAASRGASSSGRRAAGSMRPSTIAIQSAAFARTVTSASVAAAVLDGERAVGDAHRPGAAAVALELERRRRRADRRHARCGSARAGSRTARRPSLLLLVERSAPGEALADAMPVRDGRLAVQPAELDDLTRRARSGSRAARARDP